MMHLVVECVIEGSMVFQDDASCCWVCHRRFHGTVPKEHSGIFYEVPWGLFKEMSINTKGQSDSVTYTTNILNKEYCDCCKWTFFYNLLNVAALLTN